jgi:ketosteroid isomerase-like protein
MSMSTKDVGKKLVELCKQGKFVECVDTLYAPNIVSIEVMGSSEMPARMEGIKAIRGKGEWWTANHEIHSSKVDGPWPHGDRFIVRFTMDVTSKVGPMAGKRMTLDEMGLYTVRDGRIVQEEFFYDMGQ